MKLTKKRMVAIVTLTTCLLLSILTTYTTAIYTESAAAIITPEGGSFNFQNPQRNLLLTFTVTNGFNSGSTFRATDNYIIIRAVNGGEITTNHHGAPIWLYYNGAPASSNILKYNSGATFKISWVYVEDAHNNQDDIYDNDDTAVLFTWLAYGIIAAGFLVLFAVVIIAKTKQGERK